MKKLLLSVFALSAMVFSVVSTAATPTKNQDGVVEIYLEQHGGHFTARDTLAGLKPGKYQFIIENKTNKLVGFQLQNFTTKAQLDMFPLEVGQTKRTDVVEVTEEGVRFRCPINPTPWYDIDGIRG
ncbi:hypothetical protein [Shewanella gelidii]|uniref:Uncharacterized protein n=1 Tax=Shewanella gelidii TaxID=1642821 RepID=A0A917JLV9_9GAMM|nr:hypothetical protein [Shewanella gelidii]MCL1096988.1 hypothetical protein [Shewanella gelidii]GGI71746.1 hypothetical protein GCM10009332_06360 [Shewanella gelidii]